MRVLQSLILSFVFMLMITMSNLSAPQAAEAPSLAPISTAPGWVTINYRHNGADNVDYFYLTREGVAAPIYSSPEASGQYFDTGLSADTRYVYRACAVYGATILCSQPQAVRTMSAPGPAASMDPPGITNFQTTPTSLSVFWSPTGDYTTLLIQLSDELGNVDQRELGQAPHTSGSLHFPGLRSGARYRVILKGCSGIHIGSGGCGPWSADVFITTDPAPPRPQTAFGRPKLTATYTSTTVSLDFYERIRVASPEMHFQVFRNGEKIADLPGQLLAGRFHNTLVDQTPGTSLIRKYWVCFLKPPRVNICSETVQTGHVGVQMGPPPIVVAPHP